MGQKPENISWCLPVAVAVWMSPLFHWEQLSSMLSCMLVPVHAEEQPSLGTPVQLYQSSCFGDQQVT